MKNIPTDEDIRKLNLTIAETKMVGVKDLYKVAKANADIRESSVVEIKDLQVMAEQIELTYKKDI